MAVYESVTHHSGREQKISIPHPCSARMGHPQGWSTWLTNYEASGTGPVQVVVTIARTLDQALTIQRILDWPSRLDRSLDVKKD